ncbi:hypothetical protein Tco_0144775 [Tanacetum coccineum]
MTWKLASQEDLMKSMKAFSKSLILARGDGDCYPEVGMIEDDILLIKNIPFEGKNWEEPSKGSDFYHEEFADELAHIISPPEYDRFCFKIEPELGNLTMDVVGNIFQESEPRVHVLNVLPTLELDFIPSSESIFAYVDCPDCEDSQFCHSSRVSHPQLHLGIRYPNLID